MKTPAILLAILAVTTAAATGLDNPGAVRASVWGAVNRPGQYRLTGTPDLLELLSSAGGPTADADLGRVLLIRELDGTRRRIDVNRLAGSEPLFLASGDILVVPESFWRKLQRNLPLITTMATLVNLAVTVTLLTR